MTSEMIERVAMAMQNSKAWPAVFAAGSARELARAAIEAMRVPTVYMSDCFAAELEAEYQRGQDRFVPREPAVIDQCWSIAIDAALSAKSEHER